MPQTLPKVLKNWTLQYDGSPVTCQTSKFKMPDLEREMVEYRGGGMSAPVKLDMGHKALSIEWTMSEENEAIIATWGATGVGSIGVRFTGAYVSDDTGTASAVEVYARGRLEKVEMGEAEMGKVKEPKYTFAVSYMRRTTDGVVNLELDVINGEEIVGGTDLSAVLTNLLTAVKAA